MAIGELIRDLRKARGLTQAQLACKLWEHTRTGSEVGIRDQLKRWEAGKVIPGDYWCDALSHVLAVPARILREESILSRVNRRAFLSLAALAATHGKLATEVFSSIAGHDPGPLATLQTTHGTDLVIASMADTGSVRALHQWMSEGDSATLRVNAAGILAKLPGQAPAADVARVLTHDAETQHLYKTAVLSRVCALEWPDAEALVRAPAGAGARAGFLATRLAAETLNVRDAGARWCSATLLRELAPLLTWESTV